MSQADIEAQRKALLELADKYKRWLDARDCPSGLRREFELIESALRQAAKEPDGAAQTALAWSASTHDEIIKRLMAGVGMPNSTSLYVAFKQFANELHALAHDTSPVPSAQCVPLNKKTRCEECNLLVPCADPACPNAALTSTDRGSAAE